MNSFIETLNFCGSRFLGFAWPMLWQSSLLITVVFVLELALRRKVRAAIRYALWLIVLVKLALPPSLALPTSAAWWLRAAPQPAANAPTVPYVISYGDQTAPAFPFQLQPLPPPSKPKISFAAWLLTASATLSLGLLVWLWICWRQVRWNVRQAKTSENLLPILDEARRLAHLRSGIRLKLTGGSTSPAVCGLFRPAILLPQSLVEKLSAEQLRAVMLHELVHLRRGDIWVNCVQALLQIVYWWHPLLWLANARIRRVREEAVDDAVMLALCDDAEIYAPTLLEVAKFAFRRPLVSLGLVGILESRSALRQRIERLINFGAPRKAGLTIVSILGILAFSAVALPMGQAPEKTNDSAIGMQPNINSPTSTNVVEAKVESMTLTQDGKTLYETGRFEEAEAKLKEAIALDPDNKAAYYYLNLVEKSRQAPKSHGPRIVYPAFDGSPTNLGEAHTSSGREAIYRKLNSIKIDSVPSSWTNGVPLSEVLRYLSAESKARDPKKIGVNFIFNPNVGASSVRPAPISNSLGGGGAGVAAAATPGTPTQINPTTGLPETTPAASAAPKTVDPSTINIKLVLKDVSLHDLLDSITRVADHPIKYSVEDYGVVFSPKVPGPTQLETRVFRVDIATFAGALRKLTSLQTTDVVAMAENLFLKRGVDLTAPGRAVALNDGLSLLLVRATPSELDSVERVISSLNMVLPQIHIKTRFLEVPKDEVETIWKVGTMVNTGEINQAEIVSADKMKSVLRQLESDREVEQLAEPEAVVSSGRQTQMRATAAVMVLTNFALEEAPSNTMATAAQTGKFETGPTVDVVPYVLADGHTIFLTAKAEMLEFVGYDRATNRIYATNSIGRRFSAPTVRPGFRVQRAKAVVNLWDNQTLVLGNMKSVFLLNGKIGKESKFLQAAEKKHRNAGKQLFVFITATIVDPAGNRVHSDVELRQMQEKAKREIPPQGTEIVSPSQ